MDDLPPEPSELREVPDRQMPMLQAAMLRRSIATHTRTGDPCDRCGRTVLTGERVFVCAGPRVICELCIGFESEAPQETRLVHGAELGSSIRVVDKRARQTARPVPQPGAPRRRRRARIPTTPDPPE
ncbi:MAG TPA: hypothetical protein VFB39_10090 [Solirubrobacteraceae bacterium]|nr:hypothetical protein [Solirubrobacteraceae bacterium]